jgi:WD40 repeat protein
MVHEDEVRRAEFSADGNRLAIVSSGSTRVRVWDAATSKVLTPPNEADELIPYNPIALAFDTETNRFVSVHGDGTMRSWDPQTGAMVDGPKEIGDSRPLYSSAEAISPNAKRIAIASGPYLVIRDVKTRKNLVQPMAHRGDVTGVLFSPDGKRLATLFGWLAADIPALEPDSWAAQLWDAETGTAIGDPLEHKAKVIDAAFSQVSRWLATASDDMTARVWDANTGKPKTQLLKHPDKVNRVIFSPDGTQLLTACLDGLLRFWDIESGQLVRTPHAHPGDVAYVTFTPDKKLFAVALGDGSAWVSNVASGKPVGARMQAWGQPILSPNGSHLAVLGGQTFRLWDVAANKERLVQAHEDLVSCGAFSPNRNVLATGSRDKTVRLWDVQTGKPIGEPVPSQVMERSSRYELSGYQPAIGGGRLLKHENEVTSVNFSADGRRLATVSRDRKVRLWDATTGNLLGAPFVHPTEVLDASFSPDGKLLASRSFDSSARLWDIETAKILATYPHENYITCVAFNLDGKKIATTDNKVRVWSCETHQPIGEALAHEGAVITLAFSPDGKLLATGSADGTARIWDLETGKQIGESIRHRARVTQVAFIADGAKLATVSDDRSAMQWDIRDGLTEPADLLLNWAETIAVKEFDASGTLKELSLDAHLAKVRKLKDAGGPPRSWRAAQ